MLRVDAGDADPADLPGERVASGGALHELVGGQRFSQQMAQVTSQLDLGDDRGYLDGERKGGASGLY